jgi:penicillin V acylase-like amidase (Ntn superfamily)
MLRRLLIILLPAIAACNQSSLTKEEQKNITNDVRQTLYKYYDAINQSGLMAEFAYLDSSDKFFWVPPGYTSAISYDSVATVIKYNALLFSKVNNVWDSLHITPLTKELANYTGKLSSTMTDKAGNSNTYNLIETGLMIKRKDGWKLLSGQTAVLP